MSLWVGARSDRFWPRRRGPRGVRPSLAAVLLAALLAGCTAPPPASAGCGPPQPVPGPAPAEVVFATGDGVDLHGAFWSRAPDRAIVLVHGLNEDRHSWDALAEFLAGTHGWTVLAFDLRGHGQSTLRFGQPYELRNFTAEDFLAMPRDAEAALSMLRGRLPAEGAEACIVLVGASVGANLALRVAAASPAHVDAAALLSPGQDYRGLRTDDVIGALEALPLFLAAGRGDTYAAQSAQALAAQAERETLVIAPGEAHGTELLGPASEVQSRLVTWLNPPR